MKTTCFIVFSIGTNRTPQVLLCFAYEPCENNWFYYVLHLNHMKTMCFHVVLHRSHMKTHCFIVFLIWTIWKPMVWLRFCIGTTWKPLVFAWDLMENTWRLDVTPWRLVTSRDRRFKNVRFCYQICYEILYLFFIRSTPGGLFSRFKKTHVLRENIRKTCGNTQVLRGNL